ncbi:MAG: hypothetical protein K1X95_15635 [Acidimicrobiia bacterium]|nr:hypothetical protein [Acidimicrobiia bacterium]
MDATEAKADSGADSGAATRSEDPKKLVRVFFAIMAVHEHSFRVKDLAPTYLQNQYTQLVDELREALPSDLDDELARLFPIGSTDSNLSAIQSTAASLIGWLNGVLITTGAASISSPPQLPRQMLGQQAATAGDTHDSGLYL